MSIVRRLIQPSLLWPSLLLLCSCASLPRAPTRIIDLSPTIDERQGAELEHKITDVSLYMATSRYTLRSHNGPHHDAPSHLLRGGQSSDEFPLDRFYGRARVIDFRKMPRTQQLGRADFEEKGIEAGDVVIAVVGYKPPAPGAKEAPYPTLSAEAADYLASLRIKAFATDMPSIANIKRLRKLIENGAKGAAALMPEHVALLTKGIVIIEGLTNLDDLIGKDNVLFVGFPLKLKGATGAPLRAAALVY